MSGMFGIGWLWMYLGAFLMLAELMAPGFVIFFFGLSAATVGLLRLSIGGSFDLTWQIASFSALAIVYLAVLRRWLKGIFAGATKKEDGFASEYVGRTGKVSVGIRPPLAGRVTIGDAEWNAVAESPVAEGADVKVVFQDNLTMKVEELK